MENTGSTYFDYDTQIELMYHPENFEEDSDLTLEEIESLERSLEREEE